MLLALKDDNVLCVYETVADAVLDVEALDAEETFRALFDDTGEVYAIHWIRPNERGHVMVANGEYTLVPQGRKDIAALLRVILEATSVEPADAALRVKDLQRRLTT